MKRLLVIIGILAIAALSACGAASATRAPIQAPAATAAAAMPYNQSLAGGGGPSAQDSFGNPSKALSEAPAAAPAPNNAPATANRLVIQTADLTIVVADVNARVKAIETMATGMGGFIVSVNIAQTYASDGETLLPQAQIVVRVPQEKLEDALTLVKKDTVDVQNETRSGTDVTDQYVDLQSRLKAKQAAEAQLLTIMQNATKTQDVLDVYSQLQQIQSDIEVLKGQIKYFEQSAALSAISVNIIPEQTVKPIEVAGWKPQGVARNAIQKLIYFWQDFINFMINFFLLVVPVLLTIGIPLYLLFLLARWMLRRSRKPKTIVPLDASK